MTWRYFSKEAAPAAHSTHMVRLEGEGVPRLVGYGNSLDEAFMAASDMLRRVMRNRHNDLARAVIYERVQDEPVSLFPPEAKGVWLECRRIEVERSHRRQIRGAGLRKMTHSHTEGWAKV